MRHKIYRILRFKQIIQSWPENQLKKIRHKIIWNFEIQSNYSILARKLVYKNETQNLQNFKIQANHSIMARKPIKKNKTQNYMEF